MGLHSVGLKGSFCFFLSLGMSQEKGIGPGATVGLALICFNPYLSLDLFQGVWAFTDSFLGEFW